MVAEKVRGKTALITGAASGLGEEFAHLLASVGCNLILVATRAERLEELHRRLTEKYPISVKCITMDLATEGSAQRLYDLLSSGYQPADILINNAGQGLFGEFWSTPAPRLRQMLELEMLLPVLLTRLFLSGMVERNCGYILNVVSTGILQPSSAYAAFAAAKGSLIGLSRALHYELRKTAVKCTVLCPGMVRSEFFSAAKDSLSLPLRLAMIDDAAVALIGIKAVIKGKWMVVAGWPYALASRVSRFLPQRMVTALAYRLIHERGAAKAPGAQRPAVAEFRSVC